MRVRTLGGFPSQRAFASGFRVAEIAGYGQTFAAPDLWIPMNDLGSGVVDLSPYAGATVGTFTRATTGWTRGKDGLWLSVASGSPRSYYNGSGTYCGGLIEITTVNRCLWSRDLTQAGTWITVSMTTALDATGVGGVLNSASTITATLGNDTILQTIVNGSAAKVYSCFVKRKTGTGKVYITMDGDTTRTEITSSLSTTGWTRVSMAQTLANAVVGFKIETAGDAIYVDMCQHENLTHYTTPYPATSAAVTRNTDTLSYTLGAWFNAAEGTMVARGTALYLVASGQVYGYAFNDGTANERITILQGTTNFANMTVFDGGVSQVNMNSAAPIAIDTPVRHAQTYALNDFAVCADGSAVTTDTSGTLPTPNNLRVGYSSNPATIACRDIRYFNRRLTDAQLQALSARE